jgi:hypothetical protein
MPPRIILRPPEFADQGEFIARALASRALHRPWVAAPSTPDQFTAYVHRMQQEVNRGFLVCDARDGHIAGVVNLTNVVMGAFCSGYLGYYTFAGFERIHARRASASRPPRVHVNETPQARSQHPAREHGFHRPREVLRLQQGGLFAEVPEDQWPVARP